MFQLDFKSGAPICDQIVNGFIKLKALGVLKRGDQLPSVRALASKFSVNPNTVQRAYKQLEQDGFIYSIKGKGNFVSTLSKTESRKRSDELLQSLLQTVKELAFLGEEQAVLQALISRVYQEKEEDR